MGRCDGCRKQGYMTDKLQCLGSVRNFCNLSCLLQYCYVHFESGRHSNGIGTHQQAPSGKTGTSQRGLGEAVPGRLRAETLNLVGF